MSSVLSKVYQFVKIMTLICTINATFIFATNYPSSEDDEFEDEELTLMTFNSLIEN